jgi:protein-S-isoprenylcysteine O-methyltransferase Ste14
VHPWEEFFLRKLHWTIWVAWIANLWTSALAVTLVFVAFWIKLLREEAWMRETFGEKYDAYCARTKRLMPFIW